ncbi:MAG: cyclic pyranopterin monophosphate synthase MoaC [Hyphomonadaceae bacterium]|nr:cyclic pyranopterin monophosphate synthase MoaC [Hyphomonadaceae bacterium]MBC6412678.1 cyclic pyranopterin monophosphate synthase MoaC [Hyphomonadaceae bacterium]
MPPGLTHFDAEGRASMVDVGGKAITLREAVARGHVAMSVKALQLAESGTSKKGDVMTVAEIAGIMGAKKTSDLIPLCHPLPLTSVKLSLEFTDKGISVIATAGAKGRTGVEMEALMAVSTACLTVYDMLKAVDRTMVIGPIELVKKSGGKSGDNLDI